MFRPQRSTEIKKEKLQLQQKRSQELQLLACTTWLSTEWEIKNAKCKISSHLF